MLSILDPNGVVELHPDSEKLLKQLVAFIDRRLGLRRPGDKFSEEHAEGLILYLYNLVKDTIPQHIHGQKWEHFAMRSALTLMSNNKERAIHFLNYYNSRLNDDRVCIKYVNHRSMLTNGVL